MPGVLGKVTRNVRDDPPEGDVLVPFPPPGNPAGGFEREGVDGLVGEGPHSAVEVDEAGRRFIMGGVPIGLRVGLVGRLGNNLLRGWPGPSEGRPEVTDLYAQTVLDDAEQVRARRCPGQPQVSLTEPVELPKQRFTDRLEVVAQHRLGGVEVRHALSVTQDTSRELDAPHPCSKVRRHETRPRNLLR